MGLRLFFLNDCSLKINIDFQLVDTMSDTKKKPRSKMKVKFDERQILPWCKWIAAATLAV